MPVHPFLRVAVLAVTVVVVAACTGTVASQTQQSSTQYLMMADDSVGPICVHLDMPYSGRICPDLGFANFFIPAQVSAESLIVRTTDGRNIRIALPARTDAIFLTRSAMSTFLLRHYDATDPVAAANLRAYMGGARSRAP